MYRLINYVFGLALIFLFILEGKIEDHIYILIGFGLSVIVACLAFFWNWITLDATVAVLILGTAVLGLGGWALTAAVLLFFVISSLISREERQHVSSSGELRDHLARRDGYQVWANGFWLALYCILWFVTGNEATYIAAFGVIATATADTWATEVGQRNPGKTVDILSFKKVKPGTEGGVSIKGSAASLFGAFIISLTVYLPDFAAPLAFFIIILIAGFIGSIVDSVIGSIIFKKRVTVELPRDYSGSAPSFMNSLINWAATGIGGIIAFTLTQIYLV